MFLVAEAAFARNLIIIIGNSRLRDSEVSSFIKALRVKTMRIKALGTLEAKRKVAASRE